MTSTSTSSVTAGRLKTLLWTGLGLIVGGVVLQLLLNLVLTIGNYDLYRAIGWLNVLTVVTPIGTVLAVIGGAGLGVRMALEERFGPLQPPAPAPQQPPYGQAPTPPGSAG